MATKEFKTIDQLIEILENKGLSFQQRIKAKRLLNENNYYCVTAYKNLFYKDGTREFKEGVTFEDLFAVYLFDKTFKSIVLKHLLYIEQKIKNAISIQVSEKYGIDQKSYLKRSNYDETNAYLDENLGKIKQQTKKFGDKNVAVRHYKEKHGFIPFWVLSKCLTMGVIRDYFTILKPSDQLIIIEKVLERKIDKKPVRKAKSMIALFADIRNMCAHDEMLTGYVHERITISPLEEHNRINCRKNKNGELIQGKSDILALFISIKYFVGRMMYNEFIQDISSCINKCYKQIGHCVSKEEFLRFIGLTDDYETLKRL